MFGRCVCAPRLWEMCMRTYPSIWGWGQYQSPIQQAVFVNPWQKTTLMTNHLGGGGGGGGVWIYRRRGHDSTWSFSAASRHFYTFTVPVFCIQWWCPPTTLSPWFSFTFLFKHLLCLCFSWQWKRVHQFFVSQEHDKDFEGETLKKSTLLIIISLSSLTHTHTRTHARTHAHTHTTHTQHTVLTLFKFK